MGDFKSGSYILQLEAKDIVKNEYTYKVKKDNKRMYKGNLPYSLMYLKLKDIEKESEINLFETIGNKEYLNAFVSVKFSYKIDTTVDDDDYIKVKDKLKEVQKKIKSISNDKDIVMYKKLVQKIKSKSKKMKETKDTTKINKISNEINAINEEIEKLSSIKSVNRFISLKDIKSDLLSNKSDILDNNLVLSKDDLRESLYRDGFKINSVKYIRCYRTAGNARIGTCVFCRKDIYKQVKEYMYLGMELDNKKVNLANLESYICLPCTSIVGTFRLSPKNILLIDDIESTFETKTKSVETDSSNHIIVAKENNESIDKDGNKHLIKKDKVVEITNNVTDGECILDESIFINNGYEQRAVLQLRQGMYKGIGVRCNIQQFFKDNGITDVKQLNGKTLATKIDDIKMITTPSSLKYLKFGKFEDWCNSIDDLWGVASYDKGTKYFKDNLVQTHYQLLNTLPMTESDMRCFLQETLDYIDGLKNNYRLLKYHIKARSLEEMIGEDMSEIERFIVEDDNINTSNDVMNSIMKVNDDIRFTKIFKNFKKEMIKSYINNVRLGHVLVNGNYSVLVTDIYEMLLYSINKYNENECLLKPNEIICTKFNKGSQVIGSRSPHISTSSIGVLNNCNNEKALELYEKYFKLNPAVCYISGIKNNIMQQLSGFDVDGDKLLLTNNKHLLKCANKIDWNFYIPPSDCIINQNSPIKINDIDNKADIDKKSAKSTMEIGVIINTSQLLNSLISHMRMNTINIKIVIEKYIEELKKVIPDIEGDTYDYIINDIYDKVCILNIMQGLSIDSTKKEPSVDLGKELSIITEYTSNLYKILINNNDKNIKTRPNFFKYVGVGQNYHFKELDTPMDYLEKILSNDVSRQNTVKEKSLSELIKQDNKLNKADRRQMENIINMIYDYNDIVKTIFADENNNNKYSEYLIEKALLLHKIKKLKINKSTMSALIKRLTLKSRRDKNLNGGLDSISLMIINTLYSYDKVMFLDLFKDNKETIKPFKITKKQQDINYFGIFFR